MPDIYDSLIKLAKSNKYQNLFTVSKELSGIKLFHNSTELSNIQDIFLNYLYIFDSINRDIIVDKISEHVLDDDTNIYWESYLYWKKKNRNKEPEQKDNNRVSELNLVAGKKVNFPNKKNKNKKVKK